MWAFYLYMTALNRAGVLCNNSAYFDCAAVGVVLMREIGISCLGAYALLRGGFSLCDLGIKIGGCYSRFNRAFLVSLPVS